MLNEWQPRIIQLLAVPGIIVAYYLLLFHNGELIAGCSGTGWDDCGVVSGPEGQYASIGPLPVALIGLIGYAFIFFLIWLRPWWQVIDEYLPELLIGTVGLAFLFSIGLTAIEALVLRAFCRYCVVSAVIVLVMFGLSVSYLHSATKRTEY